MLNGKERIALYLRTQRRRHDYLIQSLAGQRRMLESQCWLLGYEAVAEFVDMGAVRSCHNRSGFQELVKAAKCDKFDSIMVTDFSKLTRDADELKQVANDLWKRGIKIYIALSSSEYDINSPSGRNWLAAYQSFCESERKARKDGMF